MTARRRKLRIILWTVAAVLLPLAALAQTQPPPTAGVPGSFTPLDAFLIVFGVDPTSFASMFSGQAGSILATISALINTAALTAVVLALLLTGAGTALDLAWRGESRWSIPWWIIRTVTALFMVIPMSSGYSPLQGTVMWVAYQGSEIADHAYAKVTSYMGSELSVVPITPSANAHALVKQMFTSAVCAERLTVMAQSAVNAGGRAPAYGNEVTSSLAVHTKEIAPSPTDWAVEVLLHFDTPEAVHKTTTSVSYGGSNDAGAPVCGSFSFTEAADGHFGMAAASLRTQPLHQLVADVGAVAHTLVTSPQTDSSTIRHQLAQAEAQYGRRMQSVARAQIAIMAGHVLPSGERLNVKRQLQRLDQSLQGGWFAAGAYYMTIARISDMVAAQTHVKADINQPRVGGLGRQQRADLLPWLNRATAMFRYSSQSATAAYQAANGAVSIQGMGGSVPASSAGGGPAGLAGMIKDWAASVVTKAIRPIVDYFPQQLANGRDPVVLIQSIGSDGLAVIEGAYFGLLGVTGATFVFEWEKVRDKLEKWVWPIILMVLVPCLIVFGAMAFYVPAIPFIIWIFGILGWLLMLLEAVAVAPFWGAAHAMPEGDGFSGQHARQGYMLVVSLVARPVLMIFGLVGGMVALRFAVPLLTSLMFMWRDSLWAGSTVGVGSMVFLLVFYGAMVVAVVRWSFSLIYLVPDRALNWIGSHVAPLGESQHEDQTRGYTMAAVGVFAGGGRLANQATTKALQHRGRGPSDNRAIQKR